MDVTIQNNAKQSFELEFDDALGQVIVDTDALTVTSSDETIGKGVIGNDGLLYIIGQGVDGTVAITVADQHSASGIVNATFVNPLAVAVKFKAGAITPATDPLPGPTDPTSPVV